MQENIECIAQYRVNMRLSRVLDISGVSSVGTSDLPNVTRLVLSPVLIQTYWRVGSYIGQKTWEIIGVCQCFLLKIKNKGRRKRKKAKLRLLTR